MSLIKCSECGKEISDHAGACPSCGNPISNYITEPETKVEIELTSKKWKKKFLWGMALFIIGWILLFKSAVFGVLLMFVGFFTVMVAAVGRWWTNG